MKRVKLLLSSIVVSALLITGWAYGATFTVTNLSDSGVGSLRWAIEQANANPGSDTINFSVSGTIYSSSGLPAITDDGTVIDASSQWDGAWPSGQPGIALDGSSAGDTTGLVIWGANGCHIRGLFITKFGAGILVNGGGQYNTIGGTGERYRNVISENDSNPFANGVTISGTGTDYNVVSGNYIGTDVNGTADLGNSNFGIHILGGVQYNTIGGSTPGERNIISGNDYVGVGIWDTGTSNNRVSGNYIGTDVNGAKKLGNHIGVTIKNRAQSNIIGGATAGERNIISGNDSHGAAIGDEGTNNNVVSGNYIGTDVTGTVDLGNSEAGVEIGVGAQSNTIGGAAPGERNIISGNNSQGVAIAGVGADSNVVSGNYIGTDVSGTKALGNSGGVNIIAGVRSTIGGTTAWERNVISGNDIFGVFIGGPGANNNTVSGNYIGTDVYGTADLGNLGNGVWVTGGAQFNTIGGTGNTIGFNDGDGVLVNGTNTDYNKISGNSIHNNSDLGIQLADGGNDEISAPSITSIILAGDTLHVEGKSAGVDATVEIFEADSPESGEGMTYLGSLTADGTGDFSGNINVTGKELAAGGPVTSTTTHTNSNTSEFGSTVTVLSPVEAIDDLAVTVEDMDLQQGIDSSLGAKLEAAEDALVAANAELRSDAVNKLRAFINAVEAQRGKRLTDEEADQLVDDANRIISALLDASAAPAFIRVVPSEPLLDQNYPNPFNPDTWIPYQLAEDVDVAIRIYSVSGQLVRTLDLGHRSAGFYITREKAAYWDGRDESGEKVASSVYFYTIQAGDFIATKKMLVSR